MMHQFFIDDDMVSKDYVTITGEDAYHIKKVLRMKRGEKIRVSTSGGDSYFCSIAEIGENFVQADILDEKSASTELSSRIFLFQALPKGDRMEYIIQKAVELGVFEIIPVAMKYCVVKLDKKREESRIKRWQAIAQSAAKQSKRSIIPRVSPVMSFEEAVRYACLCDLKIVPYENEKGMGQTRRVLDKVSSGQSISVMIGPEGGFSKEEIESLRADFDIISLGRRILRTDTASVCALSLIMNEIEMKAEP